MARLRCLLKDEVSSSANDLTEVLAFVNEFLALMMKEYSSVFKDGKRHKVGFERRYVEGVQELDDPLAGS